MDTKSAENDAPPMPDWAPTDGPWCLKQWLPFNVPNALVDACLLERDHDGDCRGIHGRWHNSKDSLIVGQLKMKDEK